MRRGGLESEPRLPIQLQDNQIFRGSEGIELTSFGSSVQRLLINVQTLGLSRSGNQFTEARRKQIEIEVNSLCSEIGIPNKKTVIKEAGRQFRRIVDARMSVLTLRSFNSNGH